MMENRKKIFIPIVLSIFFSIIIFLIADWLCFKIAKNYLVFKNLVKADNKLRYKTYDKINENDIGTTNTYKYFLEKKYYRNPVIKKSNKPSIILFGDSYTYYNQTNGLQVLLSKYTNRTVFNFSYFGWNVQHMYYLIKNPLLYNIINMYTDKNPEYAIYTYIWFHKDRLNPVTANYIMDIEPYLTYENINGSLQQKQYSSIYKLFFRFYITRAILYKYTTITSDRKKEYEQLTKTIIESANELKKHYPNIKFIIFEYSQKNYVIPEEIKMFEELQKNGIHYISSNNITNENLSDEKYTIEDGYHPNANAWKILSKKLAETIESI